MKKFKITQEQIIELSKVSLNAKEIFRKWFPEAFEKQFETITKEEAEKLLNKKIV